MSKNTVMIDKTYYSHLIKERDEWKERAERAEDELKKLRQSNT